ncbi:MAG: hypothetical protein FJZ78_03255 [Bacteroidetes bacterium]|nr:hypothetical protein [Bacteroidota bacterium]
MLFRDPFALKRPFPNCLFLIFLLLVGVGSVHGQMFSTLENTPASVRWKKIETTDFRIIYPAGFYQQANRMANTLQTIRMPESKTIGSAAWKMPIVLQNKSSISNGFVALGPRRSEFFTMPSQNYNFLGTNDWLNLLAVHEYRHMAQYKHSVRGFNKIFYYLFGQEALAGLSYVSAPAWFWEGDAVATETAFTSSGRGRIPNFDLVFRTNLQEGRKFNYHKQYLRSYKHFIPNHYVLGYHMVSYLRKKWDDPEVWGKITARAWHVPFMPFTFSTATRIEGGKYLRGLYREMADTLTTQWQQYASSLPITAYEVISKRKGKAYTDYSFPQFINDSTLVVMKSGIGTIDQLALLTPKGEKKLFTPGPVNETGMIDASGGRVVWNEYRFDPRWPAKNYSIVKGTDLDSGRFSAHTVSRQTRYAGAAISPDGSKVVTVESAEDYSCRLVVLRYSDGNIIQIIQNPDQAFYAMPRWDESGKKIVALKTVDGLKSIVLIDASSGKEEVLLAPSDWNVGYPVLQNGYLLFNAPVGGVDNVFALNRANGLIYQITVARYGAYNPCVSPDGKYLVYNNQSADGLDVVRVKFDPKSWQPFTGDPDYFPELYSHLVKQEKNAHLLDSIPSVTYPEKSYRKGLKLINPHSWGGFVSTDLTRASFGVTSRDVLSNLSMSGGYEFDLQERTGNWQGGASLQTFFPIAEFEYSSGKRDVEVADDLEFIESVNGSDTVTVNAPLSFSWEEKTIEGGFRIPFNLTQSRFFTQLSLWNYLGNTVVDGFKNSYDQGGRVVSTKYPQYFFRSYQDNGSLRYNRFGLNFYNLLKTSTRDINSRWGQVLFLDAVNSIPGSDFTGAQFSLTSYLYFPGLLAHHSLWGYWAFQNTKIDWRNRANYNFRNEIPLPRSVASSRSEKMYSMSVNYTMPVWYPDISIGPLINFKRVRLNGFADYAFGDNPALRDLTRKAQSTTYFSTGAEVKFDVNFFRLLPEFDFGVRVTRTVLPRSGLSFEFLLGTVNF